MTSPLDQMMPYPRHFSNQAVAHPFTPPAVTGLKRSNAQISNADNDEAITFWQEIKIHRLLVPAIVRNNIIHSSDLFIQCVIQEEAAPPQPVPTETPLAASALKAVFDKMNDWKLPIPLAIDREADKWLFAQVDQMLIGPNAWTLQQLDDTLHRLMVLPTAATIKKPVIQSFVTLEYILRFSAVFREKYWAEHGAMHFELFVRKTFHTQTWQSEEMREISDWSPILEAVRIQDFSPLSEVTDLLRKKLLGKPDVKSLHEKEPQITAVCICFQEIMKHFERGDFRELNSHNLEYSVYMMRFKTNTDMALARILDFFRTNMYNNRSIPKWVWVHQSLTDPDELFRIRFQNESLTSGNCWDPSVFHAQSECPRGSSHCSLCQFHAAIDMGFQFISEQVFYRLPDKMKKKTSTYLQEDVYPVFTYAALKARYMSFSQSFNEILSKLSDRTSITDMIEDYTDSKWLTASQLCFTLYRILAKLPEESNMSLLMTNQCRRFIKFLGLSVYDKLYRTHPSHPLTLSFDEQMVMRPFMELVTPFIGTFDNYLTMRRSPPIDSQLSPIWVYGVADGYPFRRNDSICNEELRDGYQFNKQMFRTGAPLCVPCEITCDYESVFPKLEIELRFASLEELEEAIHLFIGLTGNEDVHRDENVRLIGDALDIRADGGDLQTKIDQIKAAYLTISSKTDINCVPIKQSLLLLLIRRTRISIYSGIIPKDRSLTIVRCLQHLYSPEEYVRHFNVTKAAAPDNAQFRLMLSKAKEWTAHDMGLLQELGNMATPDKGIHLILPVDRAALTDEIREYAFQTARQVLKQANVCMYLYGVDSLDMLSSMIMM